MNEKTNSPISILADALAAMTERAMEAERQRDAAKEDATNWYQMYQKKDKHLLETLEKLSAEVEEHKKTRQALQHALTPEQNGEG